MNKITPEIKLSSGEVYPIRRNRHILVEIEKVRAQDILTAEENKQFTLMQDAQNNLDRIAKRVAELEKEYYENFDDEIGEKYEKAKAQYNKVLNETIEVTSDTSVLDKISNELSSRMTFIVKEALRYNENGDIIRSTEEANEIWYQFVDEVGRVSVNEWTTLVFTYLSGADNDEEIPFVEMRRQAQEKKASMRKGIARVI